MSVFAPIIREVLRQGAKYVYRGLKIQDRLIEGSYRKAGLYNRGVVQGVKHGLVASQVAGGLLGLGLNNGSDIGNDNGSFSKKSRPSANTQYKTRDRRTTRPYCRNTSEYKPRKHYRRSYTR